MVPGMFTEISELENHDAFYWVSCVLSESYGFYWVESASPRVLLGNMIDMTLWIIFSAKEMSAKFLHQKVLKGSNTNKFHSVIDTLDDWWMSVPLYHTHRGYTGP